MEFSTFLPYHRASYVSLQMWIQSECIVYSYSYRWFQDSGRMGCILEISLCLYSDRLTSVHCSQIALSRTRLRLCPYCAHDSISSSLFANFPFIPLIYSRSGRILHSRSPEEIGTVGVTGEERGSGRKEWSGKNV